MEVVEKLHKCLESISKKYRDKVQILSNRYGITLRYIRLETDEETDERCRKEEERESRIQEDERQQLVELKAKYEPETKKEVQE